MKRKSTKEPQYNMLFDVEEKHGRSYLGLMANESWNQDPKRFLFTLARYKFVAKMLSGIENVLEIGCADAFGTRLVQQEVKKIDCIDFDPIFINDVNARKNIYWPMNAFVHDILSGPLSDQYDAIYSLDVMEHIEKKYERIFIENTQLSLKEFGIFIVGMPSLESQIYASSQSKSGHVNCKSGEDFKKLLKKYFKNVFMFSMNDEVLHTGYFKMAHYLIAICIK